MSRAGTIIGSQTFKMHCGESQVHCVNVSLLFRHFRTSSSIQKPCQPVQTVLNSTSQKLGFLLIHRRKRKTSHTTQKILGWLIFLPLLLIYSFNFTTGQSCILEVPVLYSREFHGKNFLGNHSMEFRWKTFYVVIPPEQKHMMTPWTLVVHVPYGNSIKWFPWNVFHEIPWNIKLGTIKCRIANNWSPATVGILIAELLS